MSGVNPTPLVEVELAGSGAGWTDLRADTIAADGMHGKQGIQGSGPFDFVAEPGVVTFTLNNAANNSGAKLGYYSLYHANKRSGWGLGIGCRIRITDPATSTIYTQFVGWIDAIDPMPNQYGLKRVRVTATDWMNEAASWKLTPAVGLQERVAWEAVATSILAQMPRQPTATSFDSGNESYPFALTLGQDATKATMTAFNELASSELGYVFVNRSGTLRLENRHTRLSNTSTWTIGDADFNATIGDALTLPSKRDEIINTVRVTTHPKDVDDAPTSLVYSQVNAIQVKDGTTVTLLGPFRDPDTGEQIAATQVQPQVSGVDYQAWTNEAGTGTDLTSGFAITVSVGTSGARFSIVNSSGSDGWLTVNNLYGERVLDHGTRQAEATDSASITSYGEHAVTLDMPYQALAEIGQSSASFILTKYSDPSAQIRTATILGTTSAQLTQLLQRDISDDLTISETVTGANGEYFINGRQWTLRPDGLFQVTYTLVPNINPYGSVFRVNVSSTAGADVTAAF